MLKTKRQSLRKNIWVSFLIWGILTLITLTASVYSYARLQMINKRWKALCARTLELCQQPIAPTSKNADQAQLWLKSQGLDSAKLANQVAYENGWAHCLEFLEEQAHTNTVQLASTLETHPALHTSKTGPLSQEHWEALEALMQATLALKPWELLELEYLAQSRWKIAYKARGNFPEHWAQALAQLPELWVIERLKIYSAKNTKIGEHAQTESGIVLEAIVRWLGGDL